MAQGHLRSGLAFDLQTHPPDHVPAQVEDVTAALWLGDGLRFQLFGDPDALVRLGDEVGVPYLLGFHPVPSRVVEAGLGPTGHLPTGVVGLAHEEVGEEDRARRATPRAVGREALRRAVLVLDVELREKLRARTVEGAPVFGVEPEESGEPAVAEDGAEGVGTLREQRRDVVGLVLDAPVVVRPAWGEHIVSYPVPVYVQFVDAAGRRVHPCPADRFVQWELLAQVRARGESVGQVVVLVPDGGSMSPAGPLPAEIQVPSQSDLSSKPISKTAGPL